MKKSIGAFGLDSLNGVTRFASVKDAEAGGFPNAFTSARELGEIIGDGQRRLIEIWNAQKDVTPVKRFMNRTAGLTRLWAHITATPPVEKAYPEVEDLPGRKGYTLPEDEPELGGRKGLTINGKRVPLDGKRVRVVGNGGKSANSAKPATESTRQKVFGFPVTQAIAWMGRNGYKFGEAVATLTALGVEPGTDSTVRTYLTKGKAGTKTAAAFTPEHVASITAVRPAAGDVAAA